MARETTNRLATRHTGSIGPLRILKDTKEHWTRNKLEVDLLVQLNYSPRVADVAMGPSLEIDGVRFEPSATFRVFAGVSDRIGHLVEIADRDADAAGTDLRRKWCERRDFGFHLVEAASLRTAALDAAILLTPYVGAWPMDEDLATIHEALSASGGTITVAAAEAAVAAKGVDADTAADVVRQAVANDFLRADPECGYAPTTLLRHVKPSDFDDPRKDPFLRLLPGFRDG